MSSEPELHCRILREDNVTAARDEMAVNGHARPVSAHRIAEGTRVDENTESDSDQLESRGAARDAVRRIAGRVRRFRVWITTN